MLISTSITSYAANATFAECVAFADEVNKSFPQMADKITKIEGVVCLPEKKRVTLMYRMKLTISKLEATNLSMANAKKSMIQTWCTAPEQREVLEALDVRYSYLDSSGSFFEKIEIKITDCRN